MFYATNKTAPLVRVRLLIMCTCVRVVCVHFLSSAMVASELARTPCAAPFQLPLPPCDILYALKNGSIGLNLPWRLPSTLRAMNNDIASIFFFLSYLHSPTALPWGQKIRIFPQFMQAIRAYKHISILRSLPSRRRETVNPLS